MRTIWNNNETKHIDIETIVETKRNVNFLLAATVYLAKEPTEKNFARFNFACQRYKTTPMQLTYSLQHSIVISLQVYEPF